MEKSSAVLSSSSTERSLPHLLDADALIARLDELAPAEGPNGVDAWAGFTIHRFSRPARLERAGFDSLSVGFVVQASGFPPAYVVTAGGSNLDLQMSAASVRHPVFYCALQIDPQLVRSISSSMYPLSVAGGRTDLPGAPGVAALDGELLHTVAGFLASLLSNCDRRILAPLRISEMVYRLLQGEQRTRLLRLADDELLLVQIGSGFKTKGVDRSLKALAALPPALKKRTRLFVIGQDDPKVFQLQSSALGLGDHVTFMKGRSDIPRFLLGADLLIHPAYNENTGTVLLEALVAGLPVLVSAVCGYAHYIAEADSGLVLDEPFEQAQLNGYLIRMLKDDAARSIWGRNGLAFADTADLYSMPQHAADVILAEHHG